MSMAVFESVRLELYAAQGDLTLEEAREMLASPALTSGIAANARADRLFAKYIELTKPLQDALRFYASPELYKPHPHGAAFDRRDDLYLTAQSALKDGE